MKCFALCFIFVGCASAPQSAKNDHAFIHEFILDFDHQKLLGPDESKDLALSTCKDVPCYVYQDEDARKIKKYIVELETRLNTCKK